MACLAESTEALSKLGEAVLDLSKHLSDAERCAVTQRLQGLTPSGSDVIKEDGYLKNDDSQDVTMIGQIMMTLFWGFMLYLFILVAYIIYLESKRFESHHAASQGTFARYMKYRFGHWYTWTPGSAGIVLLSMSLCLLLIGGLLLRIVLQMPLSEGLWSAWLWIAAPDGGGSAETPIGRVIGLMVSVGGMLIFGLLLAVISEMFEEGLQGIRQGVGPIIEGDHIVILGYTTPMLQIIAKELCNANESEGGALIAILSPSLKPEAEEFLREADGDIKEWRKNSTIMVRSGDLCRSGDLEKVAVQGAKKVIIMSKPGVSREEADALTVNVLLTLRNHRWPRDGQCVAQCQLIRNQGLFKRLLNDKSQVFAANDFIGELMVKCGRQNGLARVISSVFSFEGNEFYVQRIASTAGRTFMELLFALPGVTLVGVMSPGGQLELLPEMYRVIDDDDELCILAGDDSTVPAQATLDRLMDFEEIHTVDHSSDQVEDGQIIVICGWNDSIGAILGEIEESVGRGSRVIIHSPHPVKAREQFIESAQKRRNHRYQKFHISHKQGALGARFLLEESPLERASMILVLADESLNSAGEADRQTMAVIVQVQDIVEERCGQAGSSVVIMPQLLDIATEETLVQMGIHNYIMSSRLAARIMAVVCEVPQTVSILDSLVNRKACKLSITNLFDYPEAATLHIGTGITFNDVTRVAALANEVVVGWSEIGAGEAGPWEMNPKKRTERRPWPDNARLVVLRRTGRFGVESGLALNGPRPASEALLDDPERRVRPRFESGNGESCTNS